MTDAPTERKGPPTTEVRPRAGGDADGWPTHDAAGRTPGAGSGPGRPSATNAADAAGLGTAPPPSSRRYRIEGLLGSGGQGVVYRARDLELDRPVALKTLLAAPSAPDALDVFLSEARAAASLEHPNIIPIHDVGCFDDGRPYYAMRLVSGRSLAQVLDRAATADSGADWGVVRAVQVVQQVARALQHAHAHGVLHRDVKPGNVLLGSEGEVLLVDWGIAKAAIARRAETEAGVVKGTAAYMSPEQVRGLPLDARADVYALGVVLYECLTLRLPFERASTADLLAAILRDEPPDPRSLAADRAVPDELSELVLAALAKSPDARVPSAEALHDRLQAYLEGLRDEQRRHVEAERRRAEGDLALALHEDAAAEVARLDGEIERLSHDLPAWTPIADKRPLLAARRRREEADERAQALFLEAVNRYTDALAHVPAHAPSRRALADAFWRRFVASEEAGDAALARTCRALVERFHDGRLARELRGDGALRLRVTPEDAAVALHPLVEEDLVLVDGPELWRGSGDVALDPLPMGSYVVVATAPGRETARLPVCVERGLRWEGELRLLPRGALPEGFVHVPGMSARLGGDAAASNAWPLRRVTVASFAMKAHPVTFGEYCELLDDCDPARAERLVPRLDAVGPLCARGDGGRWHPVAERIWGTAPESLRAGGAERRVPVFCVNRRAAEEWLAWLGARLGRPARLPTPEEWEVAARGADRRLHPWGDRFDPALCHGRDHFPWCDVAPVGSVPTDRSVHGVHDLAGCMQEWTSGAFAADPGVAEVRGGGWASGPANLRAAWRGACSIDAANIYLGFRAVLPIEPELVR